jgi:antitoxin component of RelBE/YafQ-DinJ toxin-antitoxin module
MTVLFRCRIEKPLLDKANKVTESLGTSTPEMFRVFVAEIARTGRVPVNLSVSKNDAVVTPWEQRAATVESFYSESKTW